MAVEREGMNGLFGMLRGELAAVREELARQNDRVHMLENRNFVLEGKVEWLKQALDAVGERSVATAAVVERGEGELAAVKGEVIGVKAELVEAKGKMTGVKGEVIGVKKILGGVKNEVTEVKRQLTGVKERMVEVKGQALRSSGKACVEKQLIELGSAVAALQKNGVTRWSGEEKGMEGEEKEKEKEKGEPEEVTAMRLEVAKLSNRVWKVVAEVARSQGEGKHTWEKVLSAWSAHTPERTSLELNNLTTLSNAALRHVPKMSDLKELSLIASSGFDAAGLKHVFKLAGLAKLDLRHSPILDGRTKNALEGINAMTGLKDLCLSYTKVTDAALLHLTSLASLKILWLHNCGSVTNAGMVHVGRLTGLEELYLRGSRVRDKGLRHLTALTNLKIFSAPTELADTGMEHVKQLTGLKRLELKDCRLGERGIACLESLPGLERIKTNVGTLLALDIGVLPGVVIAKEQCILFER